jgi:hypothetical protein
MTLLLLHAGATLALVGLIWTVQIVHYPLMSDVGPDGFERYHRRHTRAVTWVVAPLMFVEVGTAAWIVWQPPTGVDPAWAWVGAALVAVVWATTAFVSVPAHEKLAETFDAVVHRRLVSTNWIRTAAWTARGVLALWMIAAHAT